MFKVLDADTHVLESEQTWSYMDKALYPRRPVIVSMPDDTLYGESNSMWVIDGDIFPKPGGRGGFALNTPTTQKRLARRPDMPACELNDVPARLKDMDTMGVDTQVVYPTFFLPFVTHDVELEVALCRSYNRFMGAAWAKGGGRIRWVLMPPLRNVEATVQELRYGKEHGAVGIFWRGIEKDRTPDDPYFFPIYEEASALGLPVTIHTGAGCPELTKLINVTRSTTFPHSHLLMLIACRNIVGNKIPSMFPQLRFGMIEAGATWVPYVLHTLKRRTMGEDPEQWGPRMFQENRIFVSYEEAEDLPMLLRYVGEDNLVTGSDYGHHAGSPDQRGDPAAQIRWVENLRAREDVHPSVMDKLLGDNARALYGL